MPSVDRHRLHFGPYRTPRFKYGSKVICEARGELTIVKLSDGPIPWPIGIAGSAQSLVLYRDLARAVRRESSQAVQHWWGVGPSTVNKWRKALGVPPVNEGCRELKRAHSRQPWFKVFQRKAWSKARDPVRREKIAASKRGKPRPKHVIAAMKKGRRAKPLSEAARRKMSEDRKRRGVRPPWIGPAWSPAEDEAVRTLRPADAAKATGRTLQVVYCRRSQLRLPDGRTRAEWLMTSIADVAAHGPGGHSIGRKGIEHRLELPSIVVRRIEPRVVVRFADRSRASGHGLRRRLRWRPS